MFLAIGVAVVHAQSNFLGESDPQAKTILQKVTAKYKNFKTLTAQVGLVIANVQGEKLGSETGVLQIKGNKYYLDMGDQTSFSDGSTAYNLDKETKEIMATKVNPNDNMITPQKLFTDFYDKDYVYVLDGSGNRNGKSVHKIELTPKDKTQPFFKVLLEVDKSTSEILAARIFEKNGTRYTYTITSPKYNVAIPDTKFVYSKSAYPGVELVDLR